MVILLVLDFVFLWVFNSLYAAVSLGDILEFQALILITKYSDIV